MPAGARPWPPVKMTSSVFLARSACCPCSPRTQRTASATFDLPLPFGPTIPVIPGSNAKTVRLRKLLKPWSSRRVKRGARKRVSSSVIAAEPLGTTRVLALDVPVRHRPDGTIARRDQTTAGRPGGGLRVTDTRTATRGGRRGSLRVLHTLPKRRVPRACSPSLATASPLALAIRAAGARGPHPVRARNRGCGRAGCEGHRLARPAADRNEDAGSLSTFHRCGRGAWGRLRRGRAAARDRKRLLVRVGHGPGCARILGEHEGARPSGRAGRLRLRPVPGRGGGRQPVHGAVRNGGSR